MKMTRFRFSAVTLVTILFLTGCSGGDSSTTSSSAASTPSPAPAPATAPSGLTATVISSSQVNLVWTSHPSDTMVTSYTVRYSVNSDFSDATYNNISGNTSTSYSVTGLSAGTTYYFSVKAEASPATAASPFSPSITAATLSVALTGTPISPLIFGINAWMPNKIGDHTYYGELEENLCGKNYASNGICTPAEIKESSVKSMRYGGIGLDKYYSALSQAQYATMVDNMRANGIEPILQVPYNDNKIPNAATVAADMVRYINVTYGKNVKYWSVGNEPNLVYTDNKTAEKIAIYYKNIVTAMKNVDSSIKILGPDVAWHDATILNALTEVGGRDDITKPFTAADGTTVYYLDILTWHTYPFSGTQTREQVIAQPTTSLAANMNAIKTRVGNANSGHSRTGVDALKIALTEVNVSYDNQGTEDVAGTDTTSFLGGQFLAEVFNQGMQNGLEFITWWSVREGMNLGYINNDGVKLPSYHHFKMLADHFRGVYAAGTHLVYPPAPTTAPGAAEPNVKVFGSRDSDQIIVVILNQRTSASFEYTVRLDNTGTVSPTKPLRIKVDAKLPIEYSNPPGEPLATQSTVLLKFNSSGVLQKRIIYSLDGNARATLPPTEKTY